MNKPKCPIANEPAFPAANSELERPAPLAPFVRGAPSGEAAPQNPAAPQQHPTLRRAEQIRNDELDYLHWLQQEN